MKDNKLRQVQTTELEILDEIDRVCKKYNIKYFLVGGTLLGAIRHKGFIPWDDDIDIAMLREDYDKFINVCLNEKALNKKYFMHSDLTDNNYWLGYLKIRKNKTTFNEKIIKDYDTHKGIFVDIFPLDKVRQEKTFSLKLRARLIKSIGEIIFYKYGFIKFRDCRRKSLAIVFNLLSIKQLKKLRYWLLSSNVKIQGETDFVCSFFSPYSIYKETFEVKKLFPLKTITFEGKKYPCFNDVDYYLTKLYGNYMELPPENKRVSHIPVDISFNEGKNKISRRVEDNEN